MRKAIISIAAGKSQLALIETAQRMGLAVIAVDRDEEAPGFAIADESVRASTHDADEVLTALESVLGEYDVRAVVTKSSGAPVATCARVAASLGLPGLNPDWAEAATNKPGQLAMCDRAGVPVPKHVRIESQGELSSRGLVPPLVCKPARPDVGKRGVLLARTAHELGAAYAAASAASRDGAVEVETYLPGHDVVLAGIFRDSKFEPVALLDEDTRFLHGGDVRGLGFSVPSRLEGTTLEATLVGHAKRLVERLELGSGVLFLTFRVLARRGEAHVLELHFDLAGDHLADVFFPEATDYPLIESVVRALSGEELQPRATTLHPTVMRFLYPSDFAGEDFDEKLASIREEPEVESVEAAAPGEDSAQDERVGYAILRGDHRTAASFDRVLGRRFRLGVLLI